MITKYEEKVMKEMIKMGVPFEIYVISVRMGHDAAIAGEIHNVEVCTDEDALRSRRHIH